MEDDYKWKCKGCYNNKEIEYLMIIYLSYTPQVLCLMQNSVLIINLFLEYTDWNRMSFYMLQVLLSCYS